MKRFLTKLVRFWSWGFLKFLLWTVTLIIFLYVEEDWRGARAWAATKAEWEAKGESLDYNKFIPPPIPDDQNLGAIPLFRQEATVKSDPMREPIVLRQATRSGLPGNDFPSVGTCILGDLPDMPMIRNKISANYAEAFKGTKPPKETIAQLEELYPFVAELRTASSTHPLCRFEMDYTTWQAPISRPLALLISQIRVSQILALHAVLALDNHQPDLALTDIKTNLKLSAGTQRDPSTVGGLVGIGLVTIGSTPVCYGLAHHLWNDAQLAEIQEELSRIDFLSTCQFEMRSEAAETPANIDYFKKERPDISGWLSPDANPAVPSPSMALQLSIRLARFFPGGWWDQNKCQMTDMILNCLPSVNPKARRVYPGQINELKAQIQRLSKRQDADAPWNFVFTLSTSQLHPAPQPFAAGQVFWIDEARIACGLERYRFAHGVYPDSLDALAPACIDKLPNDIINGEPYHYRLRPDGTFLLYSVGWNQTDDGGTVAHPLYYPRALDYNNGDWVWPTPK